jgi:nucleoside-diphosphate-sugar epimerase
MISVYGSSGFIGSRFCEMYPADVYRVPREQRLPESDDLLYLISTTHNYNVYDNPQLDIDTNLTVLIETLEACRERSVTFNFVSSWFVYGDTSLPAKEDAVCRPKGFYSITKKTAEDLLVSYCQTFDIKYRIFRLANVLGKGDTYSERKNALQYIAEKLRNHEPIDLYYGGDFVRDYIYVDDVCRALKKAISESSHNEIINVGNGQATRFGDIISLIGNKVSSKSVITSIEPPKFHQKVQVKDMWLDISKLHRLGFEAEADLDKMIVSILE